MTPFKFVRWLKSLAHGRVKTYNKKPRLRLRLEELENRVTPATHIWTGAGADTNWSTAANWKGGLPSAATPLDDLVFPALSSAAISLSTNNDIPGLVVNSISISGSGYTLAGDDITLGNPSASGSGTILVGAGAAGEVISLNLQLGGPTNSQQFFTVNATADLTISGHLSGTTGSRLSKEGPGTLTLAADNSSFTGPIAIDPNSGTVVITNANALGDTSSSTTVGQNSQLQINDLSGVAVNEHLILNGPGPGNGALLNFAGNNVWAGAIDMDSDATLGANASSTLTINGVLGDFGAGHSLIKEGPGEVFLDPLNTASGNTYRGNTIVNGGLLTVGHPFALGPGGQRTTVNAAPAESGSIALKYLNDPTQPIAAPLIDPQYLYYAQIQTITLTNAVAGSTSFTLTYDNVTTQPIIYNGVAADATTIQNALNGLVTIGGVGGSVTVTGAGSVFTVTFGGTLGGLSNPVMTAQITNTTASVSVTVSNSATPDGFKVPNEFLTLNGFGETGLTVAPRAMATRNTGPAPAAEFTGVLNNQLGHNSWEQAISFWTASGSLLNFSNFYEPAITIGAVAGSSLTINGVLQDNGIGLSTAYSFSKVGLGRVILTQANQYTANIDILQGYLRIRDSNALGQGASLGKEAWFGTSLELEADGIPDSTPAAGKRPGQTPYDLILPTSNYIWLDGQGANADGALRNISGTNYITGGISLKASASIDVEADPDPTGTLNPATPWADFSQLTVDSILDGVFINNLTKTGPGELVLTQHNTYEGKTTIAQGWITIENDQALGDRIPFRGDTALPVTQVNLGAALVLKSPSVGTNLNVPENLVLQGMGIISRNPLLNLQGALVNLSGVNTESGSISLIGLVGIGVEQVNSQTPSDLTFTGSLSDFPPPPLNLAFTASGTSAEQRFLIDTGATAGSITINYDMLFQPDDLRIYYPPEFPNGTLIADTGLVSGQGQITANYGPGNSTFIEVVMNEGGGQPGTQWFLNQVIVNPTPNAAAGGIAKLGPERLSIQGDGTYKGQVDVRTGVLRAQNNTALGAPGLGTVVEPGAALELAAGPPQFNAGTTGGVQIIGEHLTLNGTGNPAFGDTPLTNLSDDNLWRGPVTLNNSNTFDVLPNSRLTINGTIDDATNPAPAGSDVIKTDTGELVLAGANTYRGNTLINQGTVTVENSQALGATGSRTEQALVITGASAAAGNQTFFTLTYNGSTTAPIPYTGTAADAVAIQKALLALPSVANVVGGNIFTAWAANVTFIAFDGTFVGYTLPAIVPAIVAGPPAASIIVNPQQQAITFAGAASAPIANQTKFTLTYNGSTTPPIPYTGTAADAKAIQAALQALPSISNVVGGVVSATWSAGATTVIFSGTLSGYNQMLTAAITAGPTTALVFVSSVTGGSGGTVVSTNGQLQLQGALTMASEPLTVQGTGGTQEPEVQSVTLGGITTPGAAASNFTLDFTGDGGPSVTLPFGSTAAQVQTALGGTNFVKVYQTAPNAYEFVFQGKPVNETPVVVTFAAGTPTVTTLTDGATDPSLPSRWFTEGPAPILGGQQPGAGPVTGRVTGVAVDPSDPNVIYLSAAGGGAWKTKNSGQSWTPIFDGIGGTFAGAIAIAPSDPRVIYLGTGEGNFSLDSFYGTGVYKSTDSGLTWTLLTDPTLAPNNPFFRLAINRIAVDPNNPNLIYVAAGDGGSFATFNGATGNVGVWRYNGANWFNLTGVVSTARGTQAGGGAPASNPNPPNTPGPDDNYLISFPQSSASWTDLALSSNGQLYAALGSGFGDPNNGVFRLTNPRVVNATNNRPVWLLGSPGVDTRANSDFPTNAAGLESTIKLTAVGNTIYASVVDASTFGLLFIEKSVDGGVTWSQIQPVGAGGGGGVSIPNYLGTQGIYDTAIVALPSNPNTVYVAGNGQFVPATGASVNHVLRSTDGGATWTDLSIDKAGNGPHTDDHALALDSSGRPIMGTDGGIYRLEQPGVADLWSDLNAGGLNITEFNGISQNPTDPNIALGGSQDNGTELFTGNQAWQRVDSGDGGLVKFDPKDPKVAYHVLNGILLQSTDGGNTWNNFVIFAPGVLYFPFVIDPINHLRLVVAGGPFGILGLQETVNQGATFSNLQAPFNPSAFAIAQNQGVFDNTGFPLVTDKGINTTDPDTIYITDGSRVFLTKDHAVSWVDRTSNLAGLGSIVDIQVDPRNRDTVYVVRNTFDNLGRKVYRSTDAGLTWTDITAANTLAGLPDFPAWQLQIDPRQGNLYLGTDQGVWELPAGSITWQHVGVGLPLVQVKQIDLNLTLNMITAGTYGRGMWQFPLDDVAPGSGALRAVSGASAWTGPVMLAGPTTIGANGSQALQNGVATAQLTIVGSITDQVPGTTANQITKIGEGNLILPTANTYAGVTDILDGVIIVHNPQALGSAASPTIVDSSFFPNTALDLQSDLANEPIMLKGNGVPFNGHFSGGLRNLSNNNIYTGTLTLLTDSTIGVDSGSSLTISGTGIITNDGLNRSLTKELTGTLVLTTANAYNGSTFINQGVLQIQNSKAMGTSSTGAVVRDGAQLQLQTPTVAATAVLTFTATTGSVILAYNGQQAPAPNQAFAFDATTTAAAVQTYLATLPGLSGLGAVTVTGNPAGPFTVAFGPGLNAALLSSVPGPIAITPAATATVSFTAASGAVTLAYNGAQAPAPGQALAYSAATTAAAFQTYLTTIPGLTGVGAVNVSGNPGGPFTVSLGTGLDPTLLTVVSGPATVIEPGPDTLTFKQTSGAVNLAYNGATAPSPSLVFNATTTSAMIQTYLSSIPGLTGVGAVTVTGNAGGPFTVNFAAGLNAALLTSVAGPVTFGLPGADIVSFTAPTGTVTFAYGGTQAPALAFTAATTAALLQANLQTIPALSAAGAVVVSGIPGGPFTVNFASNLSSNSLTALSGPVSIVLPSGPLVVTGVNLSLTGTGITNSGALLNKIGSNTWKGNVTLDANPGFAAATTPAGTVSIAVTNFLDTLTIDGGVGELLPSGLTKLGLGKLVLTSADSYSGTTTIPSGILTIKNGSGLGGTSSAEIQRVSVYGAVGTGGTFTLTFNGQTTAQLPAGAAALQVANELNKLSSITSTGGSVTVTSTPVVVTPVLGASYTVYNYTVTFQGGTLSGSNLNQMTAAGFGGTVTAVTTVGEGTIGTLVNAGAALEIDSGANGANVGAEALVLNGTGVNQSNPAGALRNVSGINSWAGPITFQPAAITIGTDGGALTVTGTVQDGVPYPTPAANFQKVGPGTLSFAGPNTYRGSTTVVAGILNIQNPTALGDPVHGAGTVVNNGATLQLQGGITVASEPLTINGAGVNGMGALANAAGSTNTWQSDAVVTFNATSGLVNLAYNGAQPPVATNFAANPAILTFTASSGTITMAYNNAQAAAPGQSFSYTPATTAGQLQTYLATIPGLLVPGAVTVTSSRGTFIITFGSGLNAGLLTVVSGPAQLTLPSVDTVTFTAAGSVTMGYNTAQGAPLLVGPTTTAGQFQSYLSTIIGLTAANSVIVSGKAGGPFTVSFASGLNAALLTAIQVGGQPSLAQITQPPGDVISFTAATGSVTFAYAGAQGAALTFDATTTAAQIQANLAAIPGLTGANAVLVSGNLGGPFTAFLGAGQNELLLSVASGQAHVTQPLVYSATTTTAAQIQAYLSAIPGLTAPGAVTVVGNVGGPFAVSFGNGMNPALLTVVSGPAQLSSLASTLTLASNATIGVAGTTDTLHLVTPVIDNNLNFGLTETGPGNLDLLANNTYGGPTQVNQGTLLLDNSTGPALATSVLTIGDGQPGAAAAKWLFPNQVPHASTVNVQGDGTLNLNGKAETLAALVVVDGQATTGTGTPTDGTLTLTNSTSLTLTGATVTLGTAGGQVNLGGGVTATSDASGPSFITGPGTLAQGATAQDFVVTDGPNNTDLSVNATISGGAGLTKDGAGRLQLSKPVAYTGTTTINSGDVQVDTTIGAVSLNGATASLSGTGTTGLLSPTTLGGIINPGDNGPPAVTSRLTINPGVPTVTLNSATTVFVDLNAPDVSPSIPGTGHDVFTVNGNLNLDANGTSPASLAGVSANTLHLGDQFTVVQTLNGGVISGKFAEPNGAGIAFIGGKRFLVTYNPTSVVLQLSKANATLTLSPSPNNMLYGQDAPFTATVNPQTGAGAIPSSDTVDFHFHNASNSINLPVLTVPLTNNQAVFDPQTYANLTLPVGTYTVDATFSGDNNFYNAITTPVSATLTVSVNPTSVVVTSVPPPSPGPVYAQPVTVTATITPTGTPVAPNALFPSGNATFTVDANVLPAVPLNSLGQALLTLDNTAGSFLGIGAHHISVTYNTDGNYGSSQTLTDFLLNIQKDDANVTITSTPASSAAFGQTVTLSATVTPKLGLGQPSGTVTFYNGAATPLNQIGAPATLANGIATITTNTLPIATGGLTITAVYSPDVTFYNSSTGATLFTVNKAATQVAVTAAPPAPVYGQPLTLTATVTAAVAGVATPTAGTVTFSYDGTNVLGTSQSINGAGVVTFVINNATIPAGAHTISAVYNGDNVTYAASPAGTLINFQVGQAPTKAVLTASPSGNPVFGAPVTLSATITAAPPSIAAAPTQGTVSFFDGTTQLGTAVNLNGTNVATFVVPAGALTVGAHNLNAVYNGDNLNYAVSPAGTLTNYTVQGVGTKTTVSATPASPFFGQPITFTASVTAAAPSNAAPPTAGTVTFTYDGANALGSQSVNASGVAVLVVNTPTIPVGSHTIGAVYGGDNATYSASPIGTLNSYVVQKTGTNTALTATPVNSSVFGQTVTLQATVTAAAPSTAAPPSGGTVTFFDGAVALGTPQIVNSSGVATFVVSNLTVNPHTLTAIYNGDNTTYTASAASPAVNYTVTQAGTQTALAISPSPAANGQTVTFTATITNALAGAANPTSGTVNFTIDNGTPTAVTLNGTNVATLTTSSLTGGQHSITAAYVANASFGASSQTSNELVNKGDSITIQASSTAPVFGQAVTYRVQVTDPGATGTPTGTITLTVDGVALPNTLNPAVTNPLTLTQVSAGTAQVVFNNINLGAVASHTLGFSYSGDPSYVPNSSTLVQTVAQAATQTVLTANPINTATNPVFGQPMTFVATVTAASPSGAPAPSSGTVTFFDGSNQLGTPQSISATGLATLTLTNPTLAVATHSLTAVYNGDGTSYAASPASAALSYVVKKAGTSVNLTAASNGAVFGQTSTFSATVTAASPSAASAPSTGTVTFFDAGNPIGNPQTVNASGIATFVTSSLPQANHQITAVYNGDGVSYAASPASATLAYPVGQATSKVVVTGPPNSAITGTTLTFTATVSAQSPGVGIPNSGTVTFYDGAFPGGTPIGSTVNISSNGTATVATSTLSAGAHTITAVYSGNTNFTTGQGSLAYSLFQGNSVPDQTMSYLQGTLTIPMAPALGYSLRQAGTKAWFLLQDNGLFFTGDYMLNAAGVGANEIWIKGDLNQFGNPWYYLLPSGQFFAWNNQNAGLTGSLLASLDPIYYQYPTMLVDASQEYYAYAIESALNLQFTGNLYENFDGLAERWLFSTTTNSWFYLTPDGSLYRGDGTFLASLDEMYYNEPVRLYNALAMPAQIGATVTQPSATPSVLTINTVNPFVGKWIIELTTTNNTTPTTTKSTFTVSVTNSLPVLNPIANPPAFSNPAPGPNTQTVAVTATDADAGGTLTVTATGGHLGYVLQKLYNLHNNGSFFTSTFGQGEKWLQGVINQFGNSWYYILPNGQFFAWNGTNAAAGALLATLDQPIYYTDPNMLCQIAPVDLAFALKQHYGLHLNAGGLFVNSGNRNEEWLQDSSGNWYFMLPSGQFFLWDGTQHQASGTPQPA